MVYQLLAGMGLMLRPGLCCGHGLSPEWPQPGASSGWAPELRWEGGDTE